MVTEIRDPLPEGHVYLDMAFENYRDRLGVDLDSDLQHFRQAFSDGEIIAKAQVPARPGLYDVPAALWRSSFFAERVFLNPIAAETWGDTYAGRSFFIDAMAAESWISAVERRYDPMIEEYWTLPMAASWVAFSDPASVRAHWSKYLQATGRSIANLIETVGLLGAVGVLRKRWESGAVPVLGFNSQGTLVAIPPGEVAGLELTFDSTWQDEWRREELLGPVAYHAVQMPRNSVKHIPGERTKVVPSQVAFDGDEAVLSLYEAALWAGMKGNSGIVPDDALDGGAAQLFAALAKPSAGLVAEAIDLTTYLPCTIPTGFWLMATTEPSGRGHKVSFLDTEFHEVGGMLTPHGDAAPRWAKITVPGEALRAAIPHIPRADGLPDWVEIYRADGDAGRPTSEPIVLKALELRATEGELEDTLGSEADWLSKFVTRCGARGWPRASANTIEKMIRHLYWQYRGQQTAK